MTAKRALMCLVLMVGLCGCAGEVGFQEHLPLYAYPEEVDEANGAYVDCVTQTAARIDDRKLSPIGLALKVIPLCEMQFATFEALASQGNAAYDSRAIRNGLEENKEEFVTNVVLR